MIHVFCNLEELEEEDGRLPFCDMTFEIVEKRFDEAAQVWHLSCRAAAEPLASVGFKASIPMGTWKAQVDGEGDEAFHSWWGPVQLASAGEESDRLLSLLADYYGVEAPKISATGRIAALFGGNSASFKFAERINCLTVGIESDPSHLVDGPVHMKLFFDEGVEDGHYAELFFNVDLPGGYVALNEKDESYRLDLIHWLSLPGLVNANPYDSGTVQ